ncbi:type I methionyl aminopeptidase [Treponema sp. J25]|uniref:type I methionyl aminopeptidase n=1 Tax=Treponema sp. J25 TaxID=2094121 RepID=UPI00104A759C|nr:type I methionyl aminopeptidase [Treponema sp. J25]TCW61287.1 type I methionyl aminopeptidase [Treponema sp. J25]
MIRLKNHTQIEGIRKSCKLLARMFQELVPLVQEGVETRDLDQWVQRYIKQAGGKPAFLGYGDDANPYPAALCVSINNEVIHGIPGKRKIQKGDLVSLDCGINLEGYFSDQAVTVEVGVVSPEAQRLNKITQECLYKGIEQARYGNRLLQIARSVYQYAQSYGYGVVHQYCGHGVGFSPHEDPQVPNVPHGPNPRLIEGMVLAIEPMINLGTGDVTLLDDGWTVVTADGKLSAHWEHTIAIFQDHTEILTLPE